MEKINTAIQNFSLFGIGGLTTGFLVGYSMVSMFPVSVRNFVKKEFKNDNALDR